MFCAIIFLGAPLWWRLSFVRFPALPFFAFTFSGLLESMVLISSDPSIALTSLTSPTLPRGEVMFMSSFSEGDGSAVGGSAAEVGFFANVRLPLADLDFVTPATKGRGPVAESGLDENFFVGSARVENFWRVSQHLVKVQ